MPRPTRTPMQVAAVRTAILDETVAVIAREGVGAMSMRKIAKAMSMTATNLYNYFANRDELMLHAQARGYEMLEEDLNAVFLQDLPPAVKGRRMMEAYLRFGQNHPHYYDLMFGILSPRFADYVGTDLEEVAFSQKQVAQKVADIAELLISQAGSREGGISKEEARLLTVKIWSGLHGLVCLRHSRFLKGDEHLVSRILDDLMAPFAPAHNLSISQEESHEH